MALRLSPAATLRATSAGEARSMNGIWLVETAAARPMFGSKAPTWIRQGCQPV